MGMVPVSIGVVGCNHSTVHELVFLFSCSREDPGNPSGRRRNWEAKKNIHRTLMKLQFLRFFEGNRTLNNPNKSMFKASKFISECTFIA